MRVAILGDTHGRLDARIVGLACRCDLVVHTGDVGSSSVLEALRPTGEVHAVLGNNDVPDKWPDGEQEALAALPEALSLELPGGVLAVEHGHRAGPPKTRHARLRERYPEARAVAYGHSHRRVVDRDSRPWILNPGAAGYSRAYGGPSCLLLTATSRRWRVVERVFERR